MQSPGPTNDIANDGITVEFPLKSLSYACGLVKELSTAILFLHMLLANLVRNADIRGR